MHTYAYTHTHTHTNTHTHTHTHMYVCIYVYMHMYASEYDECRSDISLEEVPNLQHLMSKSIVSQLS
jgi:hypothetical protein